jgi:carboxyl-terminal processing protease
MKQISRNLGLFASAVLVGLTLGLTHTVWAEREEVDLSDLPLQDVRTFTEIFGRIKSDYVEEVDDKTLLEYAIQGMLSGLDPHSTFLNEEDFKELQVGTSGEFGGLGIEVGMEDGFVKVVSPIDDTPAARAGVKAGDLIIRLDDTPVKGMSLNDAVKIMRGKPGSDITLTIVREGVDKPLKLVVTRAVIKVTSVKSRVLEPGFGYLRITNFQSKTADALAKALKELRKENSGSLRGLVLDLRNNPGGVLNAAVSVSDAFLDDGLIVYTQGRAADSKLEFRATDDDVLDGAPMVVLVNGGSASASEIVAGALQDHQRAIIMGSKTFGKGSVQTILPMKNTTAIKLTTARYFTPSGRSIQAEGIEPDIVLGNLRLQASEESGFEPLKEADLSGHLESGDDDEVAEDEDGADGGITDDYPLHEALNLLKGLYLLQASAKS